MSDIKTIAEVAFDEQVLSSARPVVLVDFYKNGCAPCDQLLSVLREFAREYENEVTFCKLNIEDHPSLAARFAIRSSPTMVIFKGGTQRARINGLTSRSNIERALLRLLHEDA
jgi:thioredoxin